MSTGCCLHEIANMIQNCCKQPANDFWRNTGGAAETGGACVRVLDGASNAVPAQLRAKQLPKIQRQRILGFQSCMEMLEIEINAPALALHVVHIPRIAFGFANYYPLDLGVYGSVEPRACGCALAA